MNKYIVFTDSACDIKLDLLKEWGVDCFDLTFRFNGEDQEYSNRDMDTKTFYDKMRKGGVAKTAAVNPECASAAFDAKLAEGYDILYLGFSTGLSTTYNAARIAAETLSKKYPERKILTVDTLCASAGQGLLLYLTLQKKNAGATIEEAAAFAESNRLSICHWFTVDDLVYLKRGGRVSPTVAFVGNMLGIKPVMHVDDEGHLVNVSKARGRKNAIAELAQKYAELAKTPEEGTIFISQADCVGDAELLAKLIADKCGPKVNLITDVGTVIGAHSGPGTLALFFVGKER